MYWWLARQAVLSLCFLAMAYGCASGQTVMPDAPAPSLAMHTIDMKEVVAVTKPVMINGRPYVRPTKKQQFIGYLKDSYGLPALAGAAVPFRLRTTSRKTGRVGTRLAGLWSAVWIGPGCLRNQWQCAVWAGDIVPRGHAVHSVPRLPCEEKDRERFARGDNGAA